MVKDKIILQKRALSDNITLMQKKELNVDIIEQMFKAGVHYGYSKTRRHPSVSKYIYTTKKKTDIIDLEKTHILLLNAIEYVKTLGSQNKTILFVGTKPEAKEIIKNTAESIDMPYVIERWIGGSLSNFQEIKKRIAELENYQKESASGELNKYTKKERVVLSKKMERLSKYYGGLINLKKIPDALFIIDPKAEKIATTEASKTKVTIIALANSDSNIKNIDYPLIGNDTGILSISFFSKIIKEAYKTGTNIAPKKEIE